jgi:hypothetical protein
MAPGSVLARLAEECRQAGLGALNDDELIGVLRAARRLSSWAAAMELSAVSDLAARRDPRPRRRTTTGSPSTPMMRSPRR